MTKKEGRTYLKRWADVNRFMVQELRAKSVKQKFVDFIALMSQAPIPFEKSFTKEDRAVLERWCLLRKTLGHV